MFNGKPLFLIGKSTISMAIFNSYVTNYQMVYSPTLYMNMLLKGDDPYFRTLNVTNNLNHFGVPQVEENTRKTASRNHLKVIWNNHPTIIPICHKSQFAPYILGWLGWLIGIYNDIPQSYIYIYVYIGIYRWTRKPPYIPICSSPNVSDMFFFRVLLQMLGLTFWPKKG